MMREEEKRFRKIRDLKSAKLFGASTLNLSSSSNPISLQLSDHPGVFLLPGFLSKKEQEEQVYNALISWCETPNRRNFDADGRSLIQGVITQSGTTQSAILPQGVITQSGTTQSAILPESLLFNEYLSRLQKDYTTGVTSDTTGVTSDTTGVTSLTLYDLTWSTLGRHYDWTNRSYPPPPVDETLSTTWYSPLPLDIKLLVDRIVNVIRQDTLSIHDVQSLPFIPQTVIVNYYSATPVSGSKFPMGAHRDDLEKSLQSPVVSISLGCACIFLIEKANDLGLESKLPPTAIILRSGDALLMSGKSRLALHGVPIIFSQCEQGTCDWKTSIDGYCSVCGGNGLFETDSIDNGLSKECRIGLQHYIHSHRINVNERQVD
jgi:alkylated DNA repair protein alkB family protein 1